jgi:YHS domain-containing protein
MNRLRALFPALALSALSATTLAQDGGAPAGKDPHAKPEHAEPAHAAPAAAPASADDAAVIASQKPSYPLKTCVVCDAALPATAIDLVKDGRYAAVCSDECVKKFDTGKGSYFQKIDKAVIEAQKPTYPLKTCVVKGDTLTEAKERDVVVGTRMVEVCCNNCRKKLLDDPKTYLAKVDTALIEAQSKTYPLKTCVVSGENMEEPEKLLYGTTLIEFCCKDCKKDFLKEPAGYLAKLEAARAGASGATAPEKPGKEKEKEKEKDGGHGAGSGG